MNLGHRVFVVQDDAVVRLSQRAFSTFYLRGQAALPQYAGHTILVAVAIYELENRKPKRVIRLDTQRVRVQSDGSIDKEHQLEGLQLAMNRLELPNAPDSEIKPQASKIVDAKALFDERRWRQIHPELSGPALKKILSDLFGG